MKSLKPISYYLTWVALTALIPLGALQAKDGESTQAKVEKMNHCAADQDCVATRWEMQKGQLCPTQCGAAGILVHSAELAGFKRMVPAKGAPKGCEPQYACNPPPPHVIANPWVPGCVQGKCKLVQKHKSN